MFCRGDPDGCDGGHAISALVYSTMYGLFIEENYPYISGNTGKEEGCKGAYLGDAFINGYETLASDMKSVMNHLANVGPLYVTFDASGFQHYGGGVSDGLCDFDQNIDINHAAQLVGYGSDEELGDYWLVRNSWGPSWGEDGYLRLARHPNTICGTMEVPSEQVYCKGIYGKAKHHWK